MKSIKNIFKIGFGPSSSHTMAPQFASLMIKEKYPNNHYLVYLYGSLALTGVGHLTDYIIKKTLGFDKTEIIFDLKEHPVHPNTLKFVILDNEKIVDEIYFYSVGGGNLKSPMISENIDEDIYPFNSLNDLLNYSKEHHLTIPEIVDKFEDTNSFFENILNVMDEAINRGINTSGILPGGLNVKRRARDIYQKYLSDLTNHSALIYATALAVSEENASASGLIVTAPTCGSAGIVPAVLNYAKTIQNKTKKELINALKVAGIIGEVVRLNGSISGAEVGCQGEVGVACSMASAAYCYLIGGNTYQIEYAAEIALEHHLGLTCDPVMGLVQIPCIERNAIASTKAIDAAKYAILTDGIHQISFDDVVKAMKETGNDMGKGYKETSLKGLAKIK